MQDCEVLEVSSIYVNSCPEMVLDSYCQTYSFEPSS